MRRAIGVRVGLLLLLFAEAMRGDAVVTNARDRVGLLNVGAVNADALAIMSPRASVLDVTILFLFSARVMFDHSYSIYGLSNAMKSRDDEAAR